MDEPNKDAPEVLETPETEAEAVETPEVVVEETPDERDARIAELEKKAAELESKNKQLYERAKKAETKPAAEPSQDGLTNKDVLFLAKADIHEDDIDEVLEWAKFKKVPVSDAYKQMKDVLDVRAEQRKTAAATQTGKSSRGTSKVSGDDLLSKAERTGEVPDTAEGMTELFKARLARRVPSKN